MRKNWQLIAIFILWMVSTYCIANELPQKAFQFNLIVGGGYGWDGGYLQIPYGGRPGSSSIKRPTFSELGIPSNGLFNIAFNVAWHGFGLYGSYLYNRPHGNAVLAQSLMTHRLFIPAGSSVDTHTRFDLYRFGLNYIFYLCHHRLLLTPLIEGAVVNFFYQIKTPGYVTSRGFNPVTFRIGLGGNYLFTQQWGFDFQIVSSIPDLLNTNIYSGAIHINYRFLQRKMVDARFFLGLGFLVIQLQDQQTLCNHVDFHQWPIIEGGLAFQF